MKEARIEDDLKLEEIQRVPQAKSQAIVRTNLFLRLLHIAMKIQHILALVATLLVVGCAANSPPPPSTTSSSTTDIRIISATYGSGTHYADVTSRVDYWLRQPGGEFYARPEWLKSDPTPGWNKALVIVYECKGQRHIFTTGEGGKVNRTELRAVES